MTINKTIERLQIENLKLKNQQSVICNLQFVILLLILLLSGCSDANHDHATTQEESSYTCSMHPQVVANAPGACPICGMDLVSVEKGDVNTAEIMLSERQMKLGNITTLPISQGEMGNNTILTGRITENEEQAEIISSRVEGRIEQLYIKETGQRISKGQPLYKIYSEPLLILQREFLLALEQDEQLGEQKPRFGSFLESAREKLLLYGMTEGQVNQLAAAKKMDPKITFLSPVSGIISEITASEGEYLPEGGRLYKIDRLDKVWVEAELYPGEAKLVNAGDKVKVVVAGFEDDPVTGKVIFISPEFNNNSQILSLRVEITNPDYQFLPGMQANVILETYQKKVIAIPTDAVVRSGDGAHVWVKSGEGTFKPKMVETGLVNFDRIEITKGLKEKDTVVVTGAYLLYSEYELKKGGNLMSGHNHGGMEMGEPSMDSKGQGADHLGHNMENNQAAMEVDSQFQKQIAHVFDQYLHLKDALVASDADNAKAASEEMSKAVAATDMRLVEAAHDLWMDQLGVISQALKHIQSAENIEGKRIAFAPLSEALFKILKRFGGSELTAYYQYCPMVSANKGAYWLSRNEQISNPYFGEQMLSCGETKEKL